MKENRKFELRGGKHGSAITVRITPRMSKNEIYAILDDGTVKIRLTAAPVDGKANEALLGFLSNVLDSPIANLEIVAGFTGKDKLITILNMDADQVQKAILLHLAE